MGNPQGEENPTKYFLNDVFKPSTNLIEKSYPNPQDETLDMSSSKMKHFKSATKRCNPQNTYAKMSHTISKGIPQTLRSR